MSERIRRRKATGLYDNLEKPFQEVHIVPQRSRAGTRRYNAGSSTYGIFSGTKREGEASVTTGSSSCYVIVAKRGSFAVLRDGVKISSGDEAARGIKTLIPKLKQAITRRFGSSQG